MKIEFQVRERLKLEIEKNSQLKDELEQTKTEVNPPFSPSHLFFFFSIQLVRIRETQQSKIIDIDQLKVRHHQSFLSILNHKFRSCPMEISIQIH